MQTIRNDFASSRFIAYVNGEVAGSLLYRIQNGQMLLLDVEVDPAYRRLQLPGRLISQALTEAGRRRLSVLPFCREARSHVLSHLEFYRLVPREHRQLLHEPTPARPRISPRNQMHKNRRFTPTHAHEGEAA